jgi:malate/lactate dehydrogenase
VCNLAATRSYKLKLEQAQQRRAWHTPDSGLSGSSFYCFQTLSNLVRFVNSILKAINGQKGIIEETYLFLPGVPGGKEIAATLGVDYFAVPVELGLEGVVKAYPVGLLSAYEAELLKVAVEELKGNVSKGVQFVTQ